MFRERDLRFAILDINLVFQSIIVSWWVSHCIKRDALRPHVIIFCDRTRKKAEGMQELNMNS